MARLKRYFQELLISLRRWSMQHLVVACMNAIACICTLTCINVAEADSAASQFTPQQSTDITRGKDNAIIEYGRQLVIHTDQMIGPQSKHPLTGNRLNCSNCHLDAGKKLFAAPFKGLSSVYPVYVGRVNKVESLQGRINECFERSMNGQALALDSHEMQAIVMYINSLDASANASPSNQYGRGFIHISPPNRAANPQAGAKIYAQSCAACHGQQGQGSPASASMNTTSFTFPPLWGPDAYNDGAGMARLMTAARFIKGNMPYGATAENPILSDEEAYDVAAFINSQKRPVKVDKALDYPDLSKKPKDCAYPPYADDIPQSQHQFGPFNF